METRVAASAKQPTTLGVTPRLFSYHRLTAWCCSSPGAEQCSWCVAVPLHHLTWSVSASVALRNAQASSPRVGILLMAACPWIILSWSSCERQSQEPPVLPSGWHGSLKYLSVCRMSQHLYYSSDSQQGISKAAISLFIMFYIWLLSCLKTSLTIMTFLAFILKMILEPSLRFPNLGS